MDINEDFLENVDNFYVGLDRLQYVSCRCCSRFSPFLIYLPPHDNIQQIVWGLQKDLLLFCPGCIPNPEELQKVYPLPRESVIDETDLLHALKGFEYSNPFYRKYARLPRTLVTIDTRLTAALPVDLKSMSMDAKFDVLRELFPPVHLLDNKKYSGLQEIGAIFAAKATEIREFYGFSTQHLISPNKRHADSDSAISSPESDFKKDEDIATPAKVCKTVDFFEAEEVSSSESQSGTQPHDVTLAPYVAVDKRFKLNVLSSKTNFQCDICLLTEKDSIKYGEFIEKKQQKQTFRCHYFCLLSGTQIMQNGLDSSGILGFLLKDINDSFQMYRDNLCCYCDQSSAAVLCNASGCPRKFHYICGYKNSCLTQFTGAYPSYCHEHNPVTHPETHEENEICWICREQMGKYNRMSSICSICPPDNEHERADVAWYHRVCLQRFAFEAGYYFKCPYCFEKTEFSTYAKLNGIFLPMRDASWELEKHAYKDIHQNKCVADDCKLVGCSTVKAKQLVGCKACGGTTMHIHCAGVDDPEDYVCSECMNATFIKLF